MKDAAAEPAHSASGRRPGPPVPGSGKDSASAAAASRSARDSRRQGCTVITASAVPPCTVIYPRPETAESTAHGPTGKVAGGRLLGYPEDGLVMA